jgi:RNA polymerase sigma-70 factor (ECF subfamily)
LVRFLGDFDLAEEATAQAFAIAAGHWPRSGSGGSVGSLVATARNRARDRIRRQRTLTAKTRSARRFGRSLWMSSTTRR